MSAPAATPVRAVPSRDTEFWVVSSALGVGMLVAVAALLWPIHDDPRFLITIAIAIGVGAGIAAAGVRWGWRALPLVGVTTAAYVLLVVPVAAPDTLTAAGRRLPAVLDAISAPITGWRQLITIELPVGLYQATAAPSFFLLLVGSAALFSCAWRVTRVSAGVAPIVLAMVVLAILLGPATTSSRGGLGVLTVLAPRETALVLGASALAIGFLAWRATWERRAALFRAREATGVRSLASHRRAASRRAGIAAGMVLIALVVAPLAIAIGQGERPRDVLRSGVEPALAIREAVSPLTAYRTSFQEPTWESELFRVTGAPIERVRLAVLSDYDGGVYRVAAPTDDAVLASDFRRVPGRIPGVDSTSTESVTIEVAGLSGLWVPVPEGVVSIRGAGPRSGVVDEGVYYSRDLDSAVQLADGGVAEGDAYVVEVGRAGETRDLASLNPPAAGQRQTASEPLEPLVDWVRAQGLGVDGASLAELIDRLRARGYLSHSLLTPEAGADWTATLSGYAFVPSRSGHDRARIGELFTSLIEREREVGGDAENASLVAAVGDDEQFAVAAALIAEHLGYEARVVTGFRLGETDITAPAACIDGVCSGKNLTAWLEVSDGIGGWVAVDTTPQWSNPLSPTAIAVRDPELPTDVPSEAAQLRLPPEAQPTEGEASREAEDDDEAVAAWWPELLRTIALILGIVLAIIAVPGAILAAKALRRRARRVHADPERRALGAWSEWLDGIVDRGAAPEPNRTRLETVRSLLTADEPARVRVEATPSLTLAAGVDHAVFAADPPAAELSDEFWRIVDDERQRWAAESSILSRIAAALSLRSLRSPRSRRARPSRPSRIPTTTRQTRGVTKARRTGRR